MIASPDAPPSDVGRRLVAAVVAALLLATTQSIPLIVDVTAWYVFLVGQMVLLRRTVALNLLFVSLTLYGTTAWLALEYGDQAFPPYPDRVLVASTTRADLNAILLAYVLAEALLGAARVQAALAHASVAIRSQVLSARGVTADFTASIVLFLVGAADTLHLFAIGIVPVLTGARRQYAEQLLLGGNHNVQVIVIPATIYLVSRAIVGRGRLNGWLLTAFAWTPFLLTGSRKEAIVTATVLALLWAPLLTLRRRILLGLGGALVFFSPSLRSGSIWDTLHEFILPQYMHFAIAMGLVPHDLGGSFAERALFLIPSVLRPIELSDFGQAFFALRLTGVGIGASPFGEAALNDWWGSPELSFAVVFLVALLIVTLSARRFPALTVAGFGLLVVYGRSDFWTFLFFAVYIAALLTVLLGRRRPASSASGVQPVLEAERVP